MRLELPNPTYEGPTLDYGETKNFEPIDTEKIALAAGEIATTMFFLHGAYMPGEELATLRAAILATEGADALRAKAQNN